MTDQTATTAISPFERIRRTNPADNEFWSSRDFAQVLGYTDYRNFEAVIEKARTACFNSGQRVEDHFVEITELIIKELGGTMPEDLPPAESIKKVDAKQKKALRQGQAKSLPPPNP